MTQTRENSISINSVVAWIEDLKSFCTPKEIGVVLEKNVRIRGNSYEFIKVLWNSGNISNVPVD